MKKNEVAVGLDIGTTKVKAMVGMPNPNGSLTMLSFADVALEGGVVSGSITNIDKTVYAIKEAVSKVSQEASIQATSVNVNIAGRQTKSMVYRSGITRESAEKEITTDDVERINQDMFRMKTPPGHEIIDVIPKEYLVDYEEGIKDPRGMFGARLEGNFHVITAPNNVINNIYRCASKANLDVNNLIFSSLASSLSVLTEEEKEAGVCLVDIGASMMGLTIYRGGSLHHTSIIPLAGDAITKDLAHAFMLMETQAEALKVRFGSAYEDETKNEFVAIPGLRNRPEKEIYLSVIDRVIEARTIENILLIYREIISTGFQNKLPGGIVITGGGAQLTNLDKLFSYITGYDTRLGYPYESLRGNEQSFPGIEYATCIGLVLANYKSLGNPEKYYKKKESTPQGSAEKKQKKKQGFWTSIKNILL